MFTSLSLSISLSLCMKLYIYIYLHIYIYIYIYILSISYCLLSIHFFFTRHLYVVDMLPLARHRQTT